VAALLGGFVSRPVLGLGDVTELNFTSVVESAVVELLPAPDSIPSARLAQVSVASGIAAPSRS
jgi:hypothetical protein